jgi:hypothetical protein
MFSRLTVGILLLVSWSAPQVPASQDAMLARLAIDLANDRDVAPISIDPDGSARHGVVYDRFVAAHLAARIAKLKGTPLDPAKPPVSLLNKVLVVVAVPLVCGDRTVRPADVDITNAGQPVMKWLPATGATIQKVLPGATVPDGAIAVQFSDTVLRQGQIVKVSYAAPVCSGSAKTESFPVVATGASVLQRPTLDMLPGEKAPPGGITLNISGVVDLNGELRYATAPEASTPLGNYAMTLARKMRFDPARVNHSPGRRRHDDEGRGRPHRRYEQVPRQRGRELRRHRLIRDSDRRRSGRRCTHRTLHAGAARTGGAGAGLSERRQDAHAWAHVDSARRFRGSLRRTSRPDSDLLRHIARGAAHGAERLHVRGRGEIIIVRSAGSAFSSRRRPA